MAGSRVEVQPGAGERGAFGNCRYTTGTGRALTGAFGRVIGTGKGWAIPEPDRRMVLGVGTKNLSSDTDSIRVGFTFTLCARVFITRITGD